MQVQQYIQIPSSLFGFQNTATTVERARSGWDVYLLQGDLQRYGMFASLIAVEQEVPLGRVWE